MPNVRDLLISSLNVLVTTRRGNLIINGSIKVSIASGRKSAEENVPVVLNEIKCAFGR